MLPNSVGDFVQAGILARRTSTVSQNLTRLADEVSSGRRADLQAHLRGDFAPLAALERDLALRDALAQSNGVAGRIANAQQAGLEAVRSRTAALGPELVTAASAGSSTHLQTAFLNGESALSHTISALNMRMEGRAVFAGMDGAGNALVDHDSLLNALGSALASATSAADALALADAWFAPGGPFETSAYVGALAPARPIAIGEGVRENLSLTAAAAPLRETIKAQALVSLMGRGLLGGDQTAQASLLEMAGNRLIGNVEDLGTLQADIGFREQRIEAERVRGEARRVALEEARATLTNVDSYRAATEFKQAETQLTALFQITARLSNLSLVSVLR